MPVDEENSVSTLSDAFYAAPQHFQVALGMGLAKVKIELAIEPGNFWLRNQRPRPVSPSEAANNVCAVLLHQMANTQRKDARFLRCGRIAVDPTARFYQE